MSSQFIRMEIANWAQWSRGTRRSPCLAGKRRSLKARAAIRARLAVTIQRKPRFSSEPPFLYSVCTLSDLPSPNRGAPLFAIAMHVIGTLRDSHAELSYHLLHLARARAPAFAPTPLHRSFARVTTVRRRSSSTLHDRAMRPRSSRCDKRWHPRIDDLVESRCLMDVVVLLSLETHVGFVPLLAASRSSPNQDLGASRRRHGYRFSNAAVFVVGVLHRMCKKLVASTRHWRLPSTSRSVPSQRSTRIQQLRTAHALPYRMLLAGVCDRAPARQPFSPRVQPLAMLRRKFGPSRPDRPCLRSVFLGFIPAAACTLIRRGAVHPTPTRSQAVSPTQNASLTWSCCERERDRPGCCDRRPVEKCLACESRYWLARFLRARLSKILL